MPQIIKIKFKVPCAINKITTILHISSYSDAKCKNCCSDPEQANRQNANNSLSGQHYRNKLKKLFLCQKYIHETSIFIFAIIEIIHTTIISIIISHITYSSVLYIRYIISHCIITFVWKLFRITDVLILLSEADSINFSVCDCLQILYIFSHY